MTDWVAFKGNVKDAFRETQTERKTEDWLLSDLIVAKVEVFEEFRVYKHICEQTHRLFHTRALLTEKIIFEPQTLNS